MNINLPFSIHRLLLFRPAPARVRVLEMANGTFLLNDKWQMTSVSTGGSR